MLVIESDEPVRQTVVEGLRDCGIVVEGIDDAGRIDRWRGDVIITDTFTSPYSAEALTAYLRDLRGRCAAGLIVLTAHDAAYTDAARLPADAVIMKPFDLEDLTATVTAIARGRSGHGAGATTVD